MRIVYITAGAGGTICGNCLRDNTLAAAMLDLGEDVTLLPIYTPTRTDEPNVSERGVYLGGVNIYLQQQSALFRALPSGLMRVLDNPALLRWVSRFAVNTLPERLGALTVATMEGADGPLAAEVERLAEAVRDLDPDVVHLTNSMLAGLAGPIRRRMRVPVVCSLQGEDVYMGGLPEPYRSRAYEVLREKASDIALFVAPCRDHAEALCGRVHRMVRDIAVVMPGIVAGDFTPRGARPDGPFTAGYLARIAPEKGLDALLAAMPGESRLRAAGWVSPEHEEFVAGVERSAAESLLEGLTCERAIDRAEKAVFLQDLDVLSVPTTYRASKGLYILEAWAAGVPVVQPRIGIFPELIADSGAGLLFKPGDAAEFQAALLRLRDNPEEAREMGRRGLELVRERYTAQRMARDTIALYKTLVR